MYIHALIYKIKVLKYFMLLRGAVFVNLCSCNLSYMIVCFSLFILFKYIQIHVK
ncbi:hypothetical protein Bache_1184 [Bacteroides helcogenes P 36-108]|uniref:Uncharacterized protein n=1 Tax=Bacteroides helcogenes (strain ATCC 35417 / DSM 20613 / JCM 6297 / CCUG 15421 / P 36-108) TaxID=693979 RepID=E6SST1_BACT6|nr:hypothetical protein Bache_1184 [Bacteroides helcogenes P 36-108]